MTIHKLFFLIPAMVLFTSFASASTRKGPPCGYVSFVNKIERKVKPIIRCVAPPCPETKETIENFAVYSIKPKEKAGAVEFLVDEARLGEVQKIGNKEVCLDLRFSPGENSPSWFFHGVKEPEVKK